MESVIRTGVDIVAIDDVARSVQAFGDRYLRRIYSDGELADCAGAPEVQAAGLAARFAAKEAVRKVLRDEHHQPPWPTIGIDRAPWGGVEIHLRDQAAAAARAEGLSSWSVALSHDAGVAVAVVLACADGRDDAMQEDV